MNSLRVATSQIPLVMQSMTSGIPLTMSLVVDKHGSTVNERGNSKGIGNEVDLELLRALRKNADVVLTSGKTFRADEYKFPKTSDLAVLSSRKPAIQTPVSKRLHWMQSSYASAIDELHSAGYNRIHIEYGLSGLKALISDKVPLVLFVSSVSKEGLAFFMADNAFQGVEIELPGLFLAVVAWH